MKKLVFVATVAAACGSAQKTDTGTGPGGTAASSAAQPQGQDQVFQLDPVKLSQTITIFQPEALLEPSVGWTITSKTPIAEERKKFSSMAKGPNRVIFGETLSAELWMAKPKDAKEGKANREEARKVLRDLAAETPGAAPEPLLYQLALEEQALGDTDKSIPYWDELAKRFATSPSGSKYKAYRAFYHLRANENDDAAKLVDAPAATEAPEMTYVRAWVAFRAANLPDSYKSMAAALAAWKDPATLPGVWRDTMVMGARGGADPKELVGILTDSAKKEKADPARILGGLTDALFYAGRCDARNVVYDTTTEGAPLDQVALARYQQAYCDLTMSNPEQATAHALAAWDAASKADSKDPKWPESKQKIAQRMFDIAAVFHHIYASTYDKRYGDAAKNLFTAYLSIPGITNADDAKARDKDLEDRLAGTPESQKNGLYDADDIKRLVLGHTQDLASCYEKYLQGMPNLAGNVTATIDVVNGAVPNVATDPAVGDKEMPAVAGCIVERAKTWSFPARTKAGLTRIVLPVSFAPPSAAPAAATATPPPASQPASSAKQK